MDLVEEVGKRFSLASAQAQNRLSRQSKLQSKERHGERDDPNERLMTKITQASRPNGLIKKPVTKPAPKAKIKNEPVILPVPKDSANG
jgi:hypothetical protein